MTLPYLSTTIRDPGLAKTSPTSAIALVMGITNSGTAATVGSYNSISDLVTAYGYGPAVEAAAAVLNFGGGPVRFVKIAQSAAGAMVTSPMTKSGSGPDITNNVSVPLDAYEVQITITVGGAIGTSRMTYSLDGGRTVSPPVATAATYTIANSGVLFTMAVGTYVVGDVYTTTTTNPVYTGTELAAAFTALNTTVSQLSWDFGILAGRHATATAANTIMAALTTGRGALPEPAKNRPWMMDAGADNVATTLSTLTATDRWVSPCYSWITMASSCPVVGRAMPKLPTYVQEAIKAATEKISTHFGRVASGPLTASAGWSTQYGVPVGHDEYFTPGLDDSGITTTRTVPGSTGYYLSGGRMKSALGSDFTDWHHARIFAEAHRVIHAQELLALNRSWAVKSNGTLVEDEAAAFEAVVNAQIKAIMHTPNAEGTIGHVSIDGEDPGYYYRLSRTQNVLATSQIVTEWGLRPRGYSKYITTTGGFTAVTTPAATATETETE